MIATLQFGMKEGAILLKFNTGDEDERYIMSEIETRVMLSGCPVTKRLFETEEAYESAMADEKAEHKADLMRRVRAKHE
jgi:hypothetical protein